MSSGQYESLLGPQGDDSATEGLQPREPAGWRRLAASLWARGRSEPTPRGYLVWAGVFAAMALLSLWGLLTPGNNAFFAGFAIVTNLLWVGMLVAGFNARRRRDDEEATHSQP